MRFVIVFLTAAILLAAGGVSAQEYHTIYEIQEVAVGDDSSYMIGDTVITSGIVTAGAGLFYAGSHITFYLQDNTGGPWSGVLVYNEDNSAFASFIGDSVVIAGVVSEYSTFSGRQSNMTEIVTIGEVMILLTNRPLPEIQVLSPGMIDSTNGADSLAEQYEGCLVQVQNVFVSDISSPYSQFNVTDNISGECVIRMYSDSLFNYGTPSLGTPYESITGVVYDVYGNYTIMPRTAADLVLAVGPPIITGTSRSPGGHPMSSDTVKVTCNISDNSFVEEASVFYRINGGSWSDVLLQPIGEITYQAVIPPQANYSLVDYYVYAMDDEENISYDPPGAPGEFYSYSVSDSIPTTIYEIQYTTEPESASFFVYRDVQLTAKVIADNEDFPIDSTAGYKIFYLQDGFDPYSTGGAWDGLYVYNRTDDPLWVNPIEIQRGQVVIISGTVNEYYGMTELANITECVAITLIMPTLDPVEISTADLAEGSLTGEQYEGCMVKISDVTVTDPEFAPGLWTVADASGENCIIGKQGVYTYEPGMNHEIEYIVGLVRYSSGTFKLEPRDDDDLGAISAVQPQGGFSPYEFALNGNYPNPFNPSTTINFTLKHRAPVKLEMYNIMGQKVCTLIDGVLEAGPHTAVWNGRDYRNIPAASGIYFVRYHGEKFDLCRKVVLMK